MDAAKSVEGDVAPAGAQPKVAEGARAKRWPVVIAGGLLVAGAAFGIAQLIRMWPYVSTDDAHIEGHVIQISPQVAGNVVRVHVTDNQEVHEGDLLVEIDPRDFEARVARAQAALAMAEAGLRSATVNVEATRITAPESGRVTREMVEAGNLVQPGQAPYFEVFPPSTPPRRPTGSSVRPQPRPAVARAVEA